MTPLLKTLFFVRAEVVRRVKPLSVYTSSRSIAPISTKYGFDRGTPIDRIHIEQFLERHAGDIKGVCGEIVDPAYTQKYGGSKVTKSEVIDIFKRRDTTIQADLRHMPKVKSNTFDTLIITQTFNVVDQYENAIKECLRVLKPGGVLLITMPTISPAWNLKINFWRWTATSAQWLFEQFVPKKHITIEQFGNKESAMAFWIGGAYQDYPNLNFKKTDPKFPVIIGIRVQKP